MIFSDLIQDLEPVSSRSPRSNKRKRTHMVEANDFRHFLSLGVEDPVSDTESLPTVLGVENLSRAGRLRKNSKCWQRRQPRLFHTYQSHVESYTVLLSTTVCLTIWSMSPLRNYKWIIVNPIVQLDGIRTCTGTRNGTMLCQYGAKAKAEKARPSPNAWPQHSSAGWCLIFLCHYKNIHIFHVSATQNAKPLLVLHSAPTK